MPLSLPGLEGRRARLRAFRDSDTPLIQAASSDPLIPLITTVPTNDSVQDALAFIARQRDRLVTGAGYSFAIADVHTDEAVGQIGLWLRDIDDGRVNIGYWIGADHRRAGYATAALGLLIDWTFTIPEVARLELQIEPWNEASWRLAERLDFRREGLMRQWQTVGDERKDMYLYALLRGELN